MTEFNSGDEFDLDDRFIYESTTTHSGDIQYHRVGCRHRALEPVINTTTGQVVAYFCVDCDTQLPARSSQ